MKHLFLILTLCIAWSCQGQDRIFSTRNGAVDGYDPVAYFTDSMPVKGTEHITLDWQGATWHFSSEANRDLFKANPEKYAPQYGGYCAYGVANGYKVKIEPEAWAIVEGKLYLNYNLKVQEDWNTDRAGFIEKADAQWPSLKNKE